ncbi:hypothetical protein RZS08_57625, partial [Arthrospira platensis SPKY1]|nr:hypothetical protein [Arthrospira platensis SPKY1]
SRLPDAGAGIIVSAFLARRADDTCVVPSAGQDESRLCGAMKPDPVDGAPWCDVVALSAQRENGNPDVLDRDECAVDGEFSMREAVLHEQEAQIFAVHARRHPG